MKVPDIFKPFLGLFKASHGHRKGASITAYKFPMVPGVYLRTAEEIRKTGLLGTVALVDIGVLQIEVEGPRLRIDELVLLLRNGKAAGVPLEVEMQWKESANTFRIFFAASFTLSPEPPRKSQP